MLLRRINTWLSVIFFILGGSVWFVAVDYDVVPSRFPILLAICFILCSFFLLFNAVLESRTGKDLAEKFKWQSYVTPFLIATGMSLYAVILDYCGFIVSSFFLMCYSSWILGYRRTSFMFLVCFLFVLIVYGIFHLLLGVPFPESIF